MVRRRVHTLLNAGLAGSLAIILAMTISGWNQWPAGTWALSVGVVALVWMLSGSLNQLLVVPGLSAAVFVYLIADQANAGSWAVAVGVGLGCTMSHIYAQRRLPSDTGFRWMVPDLIAPVSKVTVALIVGEGVYSFLDGPLPLLGLTNSNIVPLTLFLFVTFAIFMLLTMLVALLGEDASRKMHAMGVWGRWREAFAVFVFAPLSVAGALVYHNLSDASFLLWTGFFFITVLGLRSYAGTRQRYRQQIRELSSLATVNRAIRSSLGTNGLLNVVYEQAAELLDVRNFVVALRDSRSNTLIYPLKIRNGRAVSAFSEDIGHGLIEHVIQKQLPLALSENVVQRSRSLDIDPPDSAICSWIGVPLVSPERVLGCVAAFSTDPAVHFTSDDLLLLSPIATQAAIALDNAQLYEQSEARARQLATLNNVAALLSATLNTTRVLDLVGSSAMAVAECDAVALYLYHEHGDSLPYLARQHGLSDVHEISPIRPVMFDLRELERRRQPVVVTDVLEDRRAVDRRTAADRENKRAWIELLLRNGDELLGLLVCYFTAPRIVGAEEIELLRNYAAQAGLAISNARLYTRTDEALSRRVEQLSALADISRELTSTLNIQPLFRLVLDRALEATGSDVGILLAHGDTGDLQVAAASGLVLGSYSVDNVLVGPLEKAYRTGEALLACRSNQDPEVPPVRMLRDNLQAQINVPVCDDGQVIGVIALGSERPEAFGPEDLSFVAQLAVQARIAINNASLFRRIEVARDRLQVILDSMHDAVILVEADGRITLANPRVERLLGLQPERLINEPIVRLLRDEKLDLAARLGFVRETFLHLISHLDAGRWDESTRGGGRVTYQISSPKMRVVERGETPVRNEHGKIIGLLMVFADVTEQHDLARAREDLSSMIVHDLRGPLTAVTTSMKLLNEVAAGDDTIDVIVRQTTETSGRAVRRLLNLVDSLLDVSKLESGVPALDCEPTDLSVTVGRVVDEFESLASEVDVTLETQLPEHFPTLVLDEDKIERVLLNLVDNALKYSPSRSVILIRGMLTEPNGAEKGFVRMEIADAGPGVPDSYKPVLFDRYAQLETQRGRRRGTGLGLTFCKLTVEAHGGAIWVEDNDRGGATFVFTLPVDSLQKWEDGDARGWMDDASFL